MSLPQRVLAAGSPSIPHVLPPSTTASLGVSEPTYLAGMRQVHMMQMTRLFDQLAELASYANEMFVDLANQTLQMSERINAIGLTLEKAKSDAELIESDIAASDFSNSLQRERYAWRSDWPLTTNLFSKTTQSASIVEAYKKCRAAPQLDILDEYRNDGQSCMKFYSYPDFFVEEWKALMMKEHDGKKARRKARDQNNASGGRNIRGSLLAHGGVVPGSEKSGGKKLISITISTHARQHIDVGPMSASLLTPSTPMSAMSASRFPGVDMGRRITTAQLQNIYEAPMPVSKPPPPPPPPPAFAAPPPPPAGPSAPIANAASPGTLAATPSGQPATPAVSTPSAGGGVNFLSDIRNMQFKLRKTEAPEPTSVGKRASKKPSEGGEVAAILMRRVAIEMSDSEGDDGDDDDDEWA